MEQLFNFLLYTVYANYQSWLADQLAPHAFAPSLAQHRRPRGWSVPLPWRPPRALAATPGSEIAGEGTVAGTLGRCRLDSFWGCLWCLGLRGGRGRNALAELGCVFSNRRHARSFCQSVVPGFLVFESCLAKWLRGVINHNSRVRSQWGRDEIHAEMLIYHAIITSAAKNWGRTKAPLGHRGRCRLLPWPWRRSGELFVGRGDLFLWIHMDYMVIYQLCPNWCELLLKYHSHRGSIPTYGSYSTLFVPPYDLHRGCTHSEYPPVSSNMEVENPL